jgi:flagellar hook-associated protein 1 FlgK
MPSPFQGIETASRALRAFQRGLDVVGHNIANVNTRGFTRQAVGYAPTAPDTFMGARFLTLGSGVTIATVNRIQDLFLQGQMVDAQGSLGRFDAARTHLARVESLMGESGDLGIGAALTRFFGAWSGLAANPGESAARFEVQQSGAALAQRIRGLYARQSELVANLDREITGTIGQVDALTAQIAALNEQIRARTALGEQPNDLLDQRDLAVEDLGKLIDVQTHPQPDGTVSVHMGSLLLVDSAGSLPMPATFDASTFSVGGGGLTHLVRSGRLHGLFEAVNQIRGYQARLDALANALRTEVNALHRTGVAPSGTTNLEFFAETAVPPDTGAIDFALAPAILADSANIAAGTSGRLGDGGLALALSQMRDAAIGALGGRSFAEFHSLIVQTVGTDLSLAEQSFATQEAAVLQIEAQRQSVSGVSLDDEMAQMLRLQRSYQAAAKALSLFDQVTEDLVGLIR